jgi:diguanylate cyclase (GGDEF)-like protein/PAS domain S-box-containing protein
MAHDLNAVESARRSQLMLDAIAQAVIATDLSGIVTYWNLAAERLYGWRAQEAIGRPASELIVAETHRSVGAEIVASLSAGGSWSGEFPVQRRDGTRFVALVTDSGIYDEAGQLDGIVGVSTDITALKQAESAQREVERQLRTVVDNSPVVLVSFDREGTITLAEGRDMQSLGLPTRSLTGTPLAIVAQYAPQAAGAVLRALAGETIDVIVSLGEKHLDFRCRPSRDAGGVIIGVMAVALDITDRVRAAQETSEREARLQALEAQSADVAMIADFTTTALTYVSPAVTRLFGWRPAELLGQSGVGLVHPEDVDRVTETLQTLAADPGGHTTVEFRFRCADGSYRWVEDTISNLAEVPAVMGLVGNIRDITERREAEATLCRRDRLTRALASKAADVALVVGLDGRVRYSNPCASSVLVAAEGDTLDFSGMQYVHPDDRVALRKTWAGLTAPDSTTRMTYRRIGMDGGWRWVEQVVTNCVDDPDIRGLVVNIREITEQVAAEEALRSSEARFRLIAETAQEGIWATNKDGLTVFANQKMADVLGLPLSDFYDKPSWELITGTTKEGFEARREQRKAHVTQRYDLLHTRPDGSQRILRVVVSPFDIDGQPLGSLAMVSDITKSRADEERLQHRASHDALTGLANRTLLVETLQEAANGRGAPVGSLAVLVADIDQFKLINDSFGHACGDQLLIEVSNRWERALGAQGLLARFGGDEFAVLCPGADAESSREIAARLLDTMTDPITLDDRQVAISASIGIAVTNAPQSTDAETLLRYADTAMYEAKSKGRSRVEVFTPALIERAQTRLRLFNDLKFAIEHDQLELHYQPVVDLYSGEMLGVEALCRWTHPERGVVAPDVFVRAAESNGLIDALDRWVLKRACTDAAAMREAGVLPSGSYVAVNTSAGPLAQPGFVEAVCTILNDTGLPAGALVLEVTESVVMSDPDSAEVVLASLRRLGIKVAIDDFGTGYSSLGYLRSFPVSALKIDRSFIQNITSSEGDLAIVTAVVGLAKALAMTTTAEGVETAADLSILQQLGCDSGQGFLWSPAVSPEDLARLVRGLPNGRFRTGCAQAQAARDSLVRPRQSQTLLPRVQPENA